MLWQKLIGQALTLCNRWHGATAALALSLVLAPGALGAGAARATPGDILYVDADGAVLHAAPEAAAPVVLWLEAGRKLIEFERRGGWLRVGVFGAVGKAGWVRQDRAAVREPESAGLELPEVVRGPGAARPGPAVRPAAAAPAVVFRLVLTGTMVLEYAGHCDLIGVDGVSRRRTFAGLIPAEIEFAAAAIRCRVRKQDFRGRLGAALRRAGALIAEAETSAPFNHVVVRSAGPWGVAAGRRGVVRIRWPSATQAPRDRMIPPLTGPMVPPLTGPMIPPLAGPTPRRPGGALPELQ
jgi:hypothetical protein